VAIACLVPGPVGAACELANLAGSATKAVAGSAFQGVVDAFAQGFADIVKALMTFWIHTPDPDVSSSSAVMTSLTELTRPLVALAAVLGLVIGGAKLAWNARGDQGQSILRGLLLMTVVTGAGTTIIELALTGFDGMAGWVLDSGFDGRSVGERLALIGAALPAGTGGGLIFLLSFLGMLASIVQVGVVVVRGAILAVLTGLLPVAAGSAITDVGYEWFKKLAGWIGSFTVYKLTAAVVYAAAFVFIGDATDLIGVISGFSLIILAILALPALLRLLPPTVAAMGGGGGGALAGLATAGATGAVLLSSRGGGGSAAPAATTTPGLEQAVGPTGAQPTGGGHSPSSSGGGPSPTGAQPAPGAQPALAAQPTGAGGAGAGSGAGGGVVGPTGPTGSGGATGAAGAAGPAGAAAAAGVQAHQAARQAATGAVGEGELT